MRECLEPGEESEGRNRGKGGGAKDEGLESFFLTKREKPNDDGAGAEGRSVVGQR